jgi:hypothetical protein
MVAGPAGPDDDSGGWSWYRRLRGSRGFARLDWSLRRQALARQLSIRPGSVSGPGASRSSYCSVGSSWACSCLGVPRSLASSAGSIRRASASKSWSAPRSFRPGCRTPCLRNYSRSCPANRSCRDVRGSRDFFSGCPKLTRQGLTLTGVRGQGKKPAARRAPALQTTRVYRRLTRQHPPMSTRRNRPARLIVVSRLIQIQMLNSERDAS